MSTDNDIYYTPIWHILCDGLDALARSVNKHGETPWNGYTHTFGEDTKDEYVATIDKAMEFLYFKIGNGDDVKPAKAEPKADTPVKTTYKTTIDVPATFVDFLDAVQGFATVQSLDPTKGTIDITYEAYDEWELHEAVTETVMECENLGGVYVYIPRPTPVN